ncbi:MAG TPA: M28 family peptidase [Thermoanaerobaculia bacterium]|nr:M28 family peptidase [Thermoanaerobaculia bacterium]
MHRFGIALLIATTAASAVAHEPPAAAPAPVQAAMKAASEDAIRAHVKFLASDLLEGRGPGTRGDAITTQYLASQFEMLGLEPAGDDGSYFQKVSLLGLTYVPEKSSVAITRNGAPSMDLKYLEEFVGLDQSQSTSSTLDSEMVFVGHGVVAPEYNWDDYKDLDVRGKTLVMLVNDPPATTAEPDLFKGNARTYYGRWTYKFEIGAAKGAQAVILIHTPSAAGYGWQVVRNSWGSEGAFTKLGANDPSLKFAGWVTENVARDLFKRSGQDLDALTRAAGSRDFRPVSLGHRLKGTVTTDIRPFDTANVVARLAGSDAKLRDEAILYTAHHDHIGIGTPDATGDRIYNGAIDNATGTAIVLELARLWSRTAPRPKRSVIFAMVAAEEQGLLGSAWYGRNPSIPAGRIALALNFDAIFMIGRVRDVTMIGVERTTFNPTAEKVTKALGLTIVPDQDPEQGFYYRSDHFSLAKVGVPAFSVDFGHEVAGKPADWGRKKSDEYRENSYHQPSDEIAADWDWSSGVQMVELGFWLGWEAAQASSMPNWLPGEEFKAIRDRSVAAAK